MSPTAAPGPARRASREQPPAAGSARRRTAMYAAASARFEGCGRGRMRAGHACAWGARAGPSYIRNGLPRSQQAVTVNPGSGLASICAHAGSRANRASQDRLDTQYKGQHPLPAPFEALVGKRHGTTSPANNLRHVGDYFRFTGCQHLLLMQQGDACKVAFHRLMNSTWDTMSTLFKTLMWQPPHAGGFLCSLIWLMQAVYHQCK